MYIHTHKHANHLRFDRQRRTERSHFGLSIAAIAPSAIVEGSQGYHGPLANEACFSGRRVWDELASSPIIIDNHYFGRMQYSISGYIGIIQINDVSGIYTFWGKELG